MPKSIKLNEEQRAALARALDHVNLRLKEEEGGTTPDFEKLGEEMPDAFNERLHKRVFDRLEADEADEAAEAAPKEEKPSLTDGISYFIRNGIQFLSTPATMIGSPAMVEYRRSTPGLAIGDWQVDQLQERAPGNWQITLNSTLPEAPEAAPEFEILVDGAPAGIDGIKYYAEIGQLLVRLSLPQKIGHVAVSIETGTTLTVYLVSEKDRLENVEHIENDKWKKKQKKFGASRVALDLAAASKPEESDQRKETDSATKDLEQIGVLRWKNDTCTLHQQGDDVFVLFESGKSADNLVLKGLDPSDYSLAPSSEHRFFFQVVGLSARRANAFLKLRETNPRKFPVSWGAGSD